MEQPTQTPSAPMTSENGWRLFMRKHYVAFAAFIASAALLVAWAVYVFVWYTGNIQAVSLVPSTLAQWSMSDVLTFILHGAFWMLTLVGIPTAVGGIAGYTWWRSIPNSEKQLYSLDEKKSHKGRNAGGAISPLLTIAFAIKVYLDGYWSTAISTFTVDYVVGSMITILIWTVGIFAIPATIALVWWITRGSKKT